jgi:hypothetical protein
VGDAEASDDLSAQPSQLNFIYNQAEGVQMTEAKLYTFGLCLIISIEHPMASWSLSPSARIDGSCPAHQKNLMGDSVSIMAVVYQCCLPTAQPPGHCHLFVCGTADLTKVINKPKPLWVRDHGSLDLVINRSCETSKIICFVTHNALHVRHPRIGKTVSLVKRDYWWPGLRKDVAEHEVMSPVPADEYLPQEGMRTVESNSTTLWSFV